MNYTLDSIEHEAALADAKYGPPTSSHESLGVLYEEFHELVEAIRENDIVKTRLEAIQVAAAAFRLADHCLVAMAKESGQTSFSARSGF